MMGPSFAIISAMKIGVPNHPGCATPPFAITSEDGLWISAERKNLFASRPKVRILDNVMTTVKPTLPPNRLKQWMQIFCI